ncbi:MAG: imidazole glycerol phosphate synthase subunit HisF [Candidatus Omnitrophica bacterium]|nr:imidazole glycerol phosphate synthase subunit HisF [Candidatus Omnitrophota bacterium]
MNKIRIIPRLDIKNNTIVKGIHLEGLRVVGVPQEASLKYYAEGADEILYMDAVASLYERNSLKDIIRRVTEDVFVPLTVGGGLRTVQDIREVLRAGADKVALNTAIIRRPDLIREAAGTFGSQCIVASIEAKKTGAGCWEAYIETGREATGIDAVAWAERVVKLGAGEILVTSIDHEGMKNGFEIDLIRRITSVVPIPVIACGGCGSAAHIEQLLQAAPVSAVACASVFHYGFCPIPEMKKYLLSRGIPVSDRSA